jgi:hypothetical protein
MISCLSWRGLAGISTLFVFAASGAIALGPRALAAQSPNVNVRDVSDTVCARPAFRRFDYWAGDWIVKDSTGKVIGNNRVTRDVGGCALHEHWSTSTGEIGESFTTFAPLEGKWHQLYVGSGAYIISMSGNFDGDRLVLVTAPHASYRDPKVQVIERWTWTPIDSSRVRQTSAISRDGGATWIRQFDGFYERRTTAGSR